MSAVDSLAARLGMRRSPSGLDVTDALAQPPQEPERERLADARERLERLEREHRAARRFLYETDGIKPPYGPDPLVFGPQYEPFGVQLPVRHCRACGAGWSIYGGSECWNCDSSASVN